MKRLHLIIFMALLSVVSVGAKTKKQLVVLHTNDVHSCIMPLNENLDNKDIAGRGGFIRRVNMIKEQRVVLRLRRFLSGLRLLYTLQG